MKAVLTPDQMRELDRRTIEELGLPGIVLMELAAQGVVREIDNFFEGALYGLNVHIYCGPGNNGGDGFAVGRRLLNAGAEPLVVLLADPGRIKGDALTNYEIYRKLGGMVIEIQDKKMFNDLPETELIVDALLGTGIKGPARGLIAEAIDKINSANTPVVSVDIPSGVNGATGAVEGMAVVADITATFGEFKVGNIINPGAEFAGNTVLVDIQAPQEYIGEGEIEVLLVENPDLMMMMPRRLPSIHKGDAGKVLAVAGSIGMTGAAVLAARATLRSGAGMVKVATAASALPIIAGSNPEIMTIPLAETKNGCIAPEAEEEIRKALEWADVEVIGPGLSLDEKTVEWFAKHLQNLTLPTVIDADGLNALAARRELLKSLNDRVVLTPHIGEFARLTGLSIKEIENDRVKTVRRFAAEWEVVLLLKGVPTLVGMPSGSVFAVSAGNPGMATAGMGDVLTGAIAGLLAQGLEPLLAAIVGAALHGCAGDIAAGKIGSAGIVAGDVIEFLPTAQDVIAGRIPFPDRNRESEGEHVCTCGDH